MAEVFVSPGVYTQEIDDTFVPAGAGTIGAALIGRTVSGPAFRPIRVNNFSEFRNTFGGADPTKYMPYAAKSYLRNGAPLTVVRVLGKGTANAGQVGVIAFPNTGIAGQTASAGLSSSNTVYATIRRRASGLGDIAMSGSHGDFSLSAGGETVEGLSLVPADAGYIEKVLGTDPIQSNNGDRLTGFYVDSVFSYSTPADGSTVSGDTGRGQWSSVSALADAFEEVTGGFTGAATPWIVSQNFGGTVHQLFKFTSLADGNNTNNQYKIAISHVDIKTSASSYPAFTVAVRMANDTDEEPIVLETFTDVNLDPNNKNYIARVIGDRTTAFDLTQDPPEVLYNGDYPNKSQYVKITMADTAPEAARPAGFQGVSSNMYGGVSGSQTLSAAALPVKSNHLNSNNAVDGRIFIGVDDMGRKSISDRLKRTVTSASGTTSADHGILIFANSTDVGGAASAINTAISAQYTYIDQVGSNSGNFSTSNKVRFTTPMFGGWDGFDPRKNQLETEQSTGTDTLSGDFNTAIKILANPDEVDFNLIAMPGITSSAGGSLTQRLLDMCSTRADAFGIIDIADTTATGAGLALSVVNAQTEAAKYTSNYGATYYPWVRINDIDNDKLVWVPPSVAVMGAYAFNDRVAQPWFAPAGFNRGGLDEVLEVRRRLTQGQRDDLYTNNVNPIATFPGQGIVVFGQKTLQVKQSVLDRINVRRMMIEVRKTIAGFSRLFIFEPNSVATRERLLTQVNDYLSSVQAANGVNEFRAVLDETTTTPDLIDRNIIKGKIFLKPTTAAEIVIFDFTVTPNGAAFSE
jgi:phage tail sheath protein FI